MRRLTVNNEGRPAYDIVIESGFEGLNSAISPLDISDRKVMAVFDSNTERFWEEKAIRALSSYFKEVYSFTFPAGETSKNLSTVEDLYEELIRKHFERKDILAAVGGGVTGDMTGFTAATYLRGIRFIQIPTTLLAMCDSSVGGKTGVDFRSYKNMVGAFYQPSLVYMNTGTLVTLPERDFLSGMGEVIKYGYIKDSELLRFVKENSDMIKRRDHEALSYITEASCLIKRDVVEQDPTEKGLRAILNFGHTVGHAIEKLMNFKLLHGECVGLGMIAAAKISVERGMISPDVLAEMKQILELFGMPVTVSGLDADEILKITKSDKKMEAGRVKFVLLRKKGEAVIDHSVTDAEILSGIKEVLNE